MSYPAVILAGGRSSRMGGGDKCLLPLGDKPILGHVIERLSPQVAAILINSNSDAALFRRFGSAILPDTVSGFAGPLAGLLTGMLWAQRHHPGASHLLSVPCDTPFLPFDLVARLGEALTRPGTDIAIARDKERIHPVIGLWPVDLAQRLAQDLECHAVHAVHRWLQEFRVGEVFFDKRVFLNLNTRAELGDARLLALAS